MGNSFEESYFNTMRSTGKAIIVSALTVAGGFAVLAASTFKMLAISGLMEAMAMILSSVASITVMPALIKWVDPDFLSSSTPEQSFMERFKIKSLINKFPGGSDEDQ
jgi:predicted RND superfamily exporter protein